MGLERDGRAVRGWPAGVVMTFLRKDMPTDVQAERDTVERS
jgi:hypothetical protein